MGILEVGELILAYVVIGTLVLIACIKSKISPPSKIALVALTTMFYFIVYLSAPNILGWPARAHLPTHFKLISSIVEEPHSYAKNTGNIYIWAFDTQNTKVHSIPRSYKLPYARELHRKLVEAQKKIVKGIDQLGEVTGPNKSLNNSKAGDSQFQDESIAINFFDLPDPTIPQK